MEAYKTVVAIFHTSCQTVSINILFVFVFLSRKKGFKKPVKL